MLKFMTTRTQPLDDAMLKALANAAKTDENHPHTARNAGTRKPREVDRGHPRGQALTFHGFGENGHENSFANMPIVAQHQLGVKLVESLIKAKNQTLVRVMRSRRITDLASIPLIEDGINQMTEWVQSSNVYGHEIHAAIDQGANIRTLDDARE